MLAWSSGRTHPFCGAMARLAPCSNIRPMTVSIDSDLRKHERTRRVISARPPELQISSPAHTKTPPGMLICGFREGISHGGSIGTVWSRAPSYGTCERVLAYSCIMGCP